MESSALFPDLLGNDAWRQLAPAVRAMHGPCPQRCARGTADVTGATHFPARLLRRLLSLPPPGATQALTLSIKRRGESEVWNRRFGERRMRSVLSRRQGSTLLYEQLGPATFAFALYRDGDTIDWQLRSLHVLGIPMPRVFRGKVVARSRAQDGRYHFHVEARLPLLGQLIAYNGWLEPHADEP